MHQLIMNKIKLYEHSGGVILNTIIFGMILSQNGSSE
jgi:hypothetical protein